MKPFDLLHLSRTCRALREQLLSKKSKVIWQASLSAALVPLCPDDDSINEPQLASLLFETVCQVC